MGSVEAGQAFVLLGVRDKLDEGLKAASSKLKDAAKKFAAIGASISAVGAATMTPLVAMANSFANGAAEMKKLSTQTRISVEELSKLKYASSQVGVDFEDAAGALEEFNIRMGETLQDSMGAAHDAFKQLGIDAKSLSMLPISEQIGLIGEALNKLPRSQRQFLADEIFGGDAFKILPLLERGADGIRDLGKEAEEFGAVMSSEAAEGAAEYVAALAKLNTVVKSMKNAIGSALIPYMTQLSDLMTTTLNPIREMVAENKKLFVMIAAGSAALIAAGTAVTGFGLALYIAGVAVGAIGAAIAAILSPIGLAISGIAALGIAIFKYTDYGAKGLEWFGNAIEDVGKLFGHTFARIENAVATGNLNEAFDAVVEGLELSWLGVVDQMASVWGTFMNYFYDISKAITKAVAGLFQQLGKMIQTLSKAYGKYYDTVYNSLVEFFGEMGGVKTIGGSGKVFNGGQALEEFGIGVDFEQIGGSLMDFGKALDDSADGIGKDAKADRAARAAEREKRMAELRAKITREGILAEFANADRRRYRGDDQPELPSVEPQMAMQEEMSHAARGTFSGFGAMFLGGQQSIQKDQLDVQKQIAENTEQMVDQGNGGVFV